MVPTETAVVSASVILVNAANSKAAAPQGLVFLAHPALLVEQLGNAPGFLVVVFQSRMVGDSNFDLDCILKWL